VLTYSLLLLTPCISSQLIGGAGTQQRVGLVVYRYSQSGGKQGDGKVVKAGANKRKTTSMNDASGATNTSVADGNVAIQLSCAPLKIENSRGNMVYVQPQVTLKRTYVESLTEDEPHIITKFSDGRDFPLNLEIRLGGKPTEEELAKLQKKIKQKPKKKKKKKKSSKK
jgi:hypothetical protein